MVRGAKREVISAELQPDPAHARSAARFSDAQCGFKAVRTDVARALLPLVEDQGWFFDTELLVLAEHNGLRIHEVPVDWVDDPDSRVDVVGTAKGDLKGVGRMLARFARGDGTVERRRPGRRGDARRTAWRSSSCASRRSASSARCCSRCCSRCWPGRSAPVWADIVALTTCALANTAANRRLTFALQGRAGRVRHYLAGLAVSSLPLGAHPPHAGARWSAVGRDLAGGRARPAHPRQRRGHYGPVRAAPQLGVPARLEARASTWTPSAA